MLLYLESDILNKWQFSRIYGSEMAAINTSVFNKGDFQDFPDSGHILSIFQYNAIYRDFFVFDIVV